MAGSQKISLYELLGNEERRQQVMEWSTYLELSPTECAERCARELSVETSAQGVAAFLRKYDFAWRIGVAKEQADAEKNALPEHWETRIREGLAQRRFEATFKVLSAQELVALDKLELEHRKVELRASEVYLAERRQLVAERKLKEAQRTLADAALPTEEQTQRIRRILGAE